MHRVYGMKDFQVTESSKWSGKRPVPAIGEAVEINFNDLGDGIVRGYFIEDVWLGVYVELNNPPAWWVRQQKKYENRLGHIPGCAMVFGLELKGQEVPVDKNCT